MDLLKGKSIEQVIKEDEEALAEYKECFHKNRYLFITRDGSEHERCRDCGYEE